MKRYYFLAIFLILYVSFACSNDRLEQEAPNLQPYPEETKSVLGRGLVVLPKNGNRIFLSWRLLPDDPAEVAFHVYRQKDDDLGPEPKLVAQTANTFYLDSDVQENHRYTYSITPLLLDKEDEALPRLTVSASRKGESALVFDIGQEYKQARLVTGDLNGDGELEVVIGYANNIGVDPWEKAWQKSEDTIKVAAFRPTGQRLWTIDLGWGIEAGPFYAPMVVWDIDADGRAEVILKTNHSADPRDYDGERLTILDGETGRIKQEAQWPPSDGLHGDYNSNSRNYIAIAHLDGRHTYIIVARGLYKTQRIWAYDNTLNRVWERIVGRDHYIPLQNRWLRAIWKRLFTNRSRGSHSLPIVDINGDGKEEIMWGEHCIGEDGQDLWAIDEHMPYPGHPDIVFAADVLPSTKGKEVFYCREGWVGESRKIGMLLADNKGQIIWAHWGYSHVDGGWVAKILPDQEGMQCYGIDIQTKKFEEGGFKREGIVGSLWSSDGRLIDKPPDSWGRSIPVDWDGDGIQELCMMNGDVQKYKGPTLARIGEGVLWGGDLFGDHREEIVVAPRDGKVYIYFNTEKRQSSPRLTPLADRQYKNDLSRTAMQMTVIPTEGGYMARKK